MTHSNNIRRRVVFAAFTLATVVAGVFVGALYFALDIAEDRLFDKHLLDDVDYYLRAYAYDPRFAEISQPNITVHVAGQPNSATLPGYLHNLAPGEDAVIINGKEFELQVRTVDSRTFYFLIDESEFEEFERALIVGMAIVVFIVVAGATWAGHLIAERIIQPLIQLSRRVDTMGNGDGLGVTLTDYTDADDEVAHLAVAIGGYHRRISELLQREHEFSADVSHELRTPIMAVQGAAALLAKQILDDKGHELIARITRGCFHMTALTEALLFLARDPESFKDMVEPVSIKRVIEGQLAAIRDVVDRRGITVNVEESADAVIYTIPAVIEIVVGNILKNAIKYTNRDLISIFVNKAEIVIQDYGPGIDRAVQATLFDRFNRGHHRNSDGSGIGLALVRRFCEQYGWGIDFRSDQETGTRVAVVF